LATFLFEGLRGSAASPGSREELRQATGDTKLPALRLPDGTVLTHSRTILAWVKQGRHEPSP
jgi:glutathione S-transferase